MSTCSQEDKELDHLHNYASRSNPYQPVTSDSRRSNESSLRLSTPEEVAGDHHISETTFRLGDCSSSGKVSNLLTRSSANTWPLQPLSAKITLDIKPGVIHSASPEKMSDYFNAEYHKKTKEHTTLEMGIDNNMSKQVFPARPSEKSGSYGQTNSLFSSSAINRTTSTSKNQKFPAELEEVTVDSKKPTSLLTELLSKSTRDPSRSTSDLLKYWSDSSLINSKQKSNFGSTQALAGSESSNSDGSISSYSECSNNPMQSLLHRREIPMQKLADKFLLPSHLGSECSSTFGSRVSLDGSNCENRNSTKLKCSSTNENCSSRVTAESSHHLQRDKRYNDREPFNSDSVSRRSGYTLLDQYNVREDDRRKSRHKSKRQPARKIVSSASDDDKSEMGSTCDITQQIENSDALASFSHDKRAPRSGTKGNDSEFSQNVCLDVFASFQDNSEEAWFDSVTKLNQEWFRNGGDPEAGSKVTISTINLSNRSGNLFEKGKPPPRSIILTPLSSLPGDRPSTSTNWNNNSEINKNDALNKVKLSMTASSAVINSINQQRRNIVTAPLANVFTEPHPTTHAGTSNSLVTPRNNHSYSHHLNNPSHFLHHNSSTPELKNLLLLSSANKSMAASDSSTNATFGSHHTNVPSPAVTTSRASDVFLRGATVANTSRSNMSALKKALQHRGFPWSRLHKKSQVNLIKPNIDGNEVVYSWQRENLVFGGDYI